MGREPLFDRTVPDESHGAPEPRRIGILLLDDQPHVPASLGANPLLHRVPQRGSQPSTALMRREDQDSHIPFSLARVSLEEVHDRDDRTATLERNNVLAVEWNTRWT